MHGEPKNLLAGERHFFVDVLAIVIQPVQNSIFVVSTHFTVRAAAYETVSLPEAGIGERSLAACS